MDHHRSATDRGTGRQDGRGTIAQWLGNADNFTGVVDRTDRTRVSAAVGTRGNGGYYAFGPPAIRISRGTTVVWNWTGNGGSHDVVARDGRFQSTLTSAADATFSHTFETTGTALYYCTPHRSLGMKGAVVVV